MGRRLSFQHAEKRGHMTWVTKQNGMSNGTHMCPKTTQQTLHVRSMGQRLHHITVLIENVQSDPLTPPLQIKCLIGNVVRLM